MKRLAFILAILSALFLSGQAAATISLDYAPDKYSCDGVITSYGYTWQIYKDDELSVYVETSTGAQDQLTLNTDYTVTGAGDATGGNVVLTDGANCSDGCTLVISRTIDFYQDTEYVDGNIRASALETPHDKAMLLAQQQEDELSRCLKLKLGTDYTDMLVPEPESNTVLGWNASSELANLSLGSGGTWDGFADLGSTASTKGGNLVSSQGGGTHGDLHPWIVSTAASITDHSDATDDGSISWVIAQIGSDVETVTVAAKDTTYVIADGQTITVPANITLDINPGAIIDGTSGGAAETLVLNGPVKTTRNQCFGSDLVVTPGRAAFSDFCPEWWGADNAGAIESSAAFAAMTTALAACYGGGIELTGRYKLDSTWSIDDLDGLRIHGQSGHTGAGLKRTMLDFSGVVSGDDNGIEISNSTHVEISDLYISIFSETVTGSGAAIEISLGSATHLKGLAIDAGRGATSYGIQFGESALGSAVIASSIENCVVGCYLGTPFYYGVGCTSIATSYCYALHAGKFGYHIKESTYSSFTSCAADSGKVGAWGYGIDGCGGITLTACGAETNGLGFAKVFGGTIGVTFIDPRGVDNNNDASTAYASLIDIGATGTNGNITIINPRDSSADAATIHAIWGKAGTLLTTIINEETSVALLDGIGGDATWMNTWLNIVGSTNYNQFMPTDFVNWFGIRGTSGGLRTRRVEATSDLAGATTDVAVTDIVSGDKLLGVQIRVDSTITFTGAGATWSAAWLTGATQAIAAGQLPAQNTKVNVFFDENADTAISTGNMSVRFTPNSDTFSDGSVTVIAYYQEMATMGSL